jgi:hypothetical protein
MKQPVKIMGAGPAGLAAAITLARHNYEVVVYEKRRDCGARFRGDLQGLENWTSETPILDEIRHFGLEINFDCAPIDTVHTFAANQNHVVVNKTVFQAKRDLFYLVKRGARPGTLDQGLKAQALEAGVQLLFDTTLDEAEADIVAAGPHPHRLFALDTGIIFETDMADGAYGLLNDQSSYHGYSYLLVTGGYGCMCTVPFERYSTIHEQFDLVKKSFIQLTGVTIKNPTRVGGYGAFTHRPCYTRDGRFYIGEAAGLQDLLAASIQAAR